MSERIEPLSIRADDMNDLQVSRLPDGSFYFAVSDFAGTIDCPRQSAAIALTPEQARELAAWIMATSEEIAA